MSLRLSVLDQSPVSEGAPRTTAITSTARLAALERQTHDGTTRHVSYEAGETRHVIFPTGQYLLLGLENTSNHDLAFVTVEHKRNPAPGRPYPR
jgi:hypothetical protein